MKITNEPHVLYLFSRYHELLGFEDIVNVQTAFPDITAIRDGKPVRIELEFIAGRIAIHYPIQGSTVYQRYGERLEHKAGKWHKIAPCLLVKGAERVFHSWDDEGGNLYVRRGPYASTLIRKSLKPHIDIVICWTACESRRSSLEKEGIEVIELKSKLVELGITKFR